jgi:hypothetical protein
MAEGDKKQCFVIGPIGEEGGPERLHADWLYDGIIFPVFQKDFPDWKVDRADKIPTPGMVSSQIINRLHDVELVIADLSFHNANAFYEMSIRHKVGKPIIHMIRKDEKIPFDVIPHRAIRFSRVHPNDLKEACEALKLSVAEAIKPNFEPDNPISHARGKLELERTATPAMKVLADELAELRARFGSLENAIARISAVTSSSQLGLWPNLARILGAEPLTAEQELMVRALSTHQTPLIATKAEPTQKAAPTTDPLFITTIHKSE